MILAIPFPAIDPVLVHIGPIAIRWYALAYVAGLLIGWRYIRYLAQRLPVAMGPRGVDDLLVWVTLGVVLGGRLGYVLFYNPGFYLAHPIQILYVWQGGMAFHGGLIGVIVAVVLFARQRRMNPLAVGDAIACAAPIGLLFGRIANFINGELFGRVSDVPWAMAFPNGGPAPRHPSQLYEAVLEGLVLFVLLLALAHWTNLPRRLGLLSGILFAGYALARIVVELFRQPDAHLGFIFAGVTMGQLLSLPMLGLGLYLIARARPMATAESAP